MSYSGETFPSKPFEFVLDRPNITYVSGAGPNVFGHVLFCFGPTVGYIHVDEFYAYPKLLTPDGFNRYIGDNEKTVLHREFLADITSSQGTLDEAERLRQIKWLWAIVPHNCVCFAEQIVQAGGSKWTSKSNLPSVSAKVETTRDSIKQTVRMLDNIRKYGRPF